jgi:F420-non-reducing hydrogenase iron-sulfur subunit
LGVAAYCQEVKAVSESEEFDPIIVGFFCNWCTATAADLAGVSRLQYPPNVRPIRTMCSGSVDPMYVLRALLNGADAVIIGGCNPGDCHYVSGNYKARRRIAALKTVLNTLGLDDDRVWLRWISAAEGPKFAKTMAEITEKIKEKGPSPLRTYWSG